MTRSILIPLVVLGLGGCASRGQPSAPNTPATSTPAAGTAPTAPAAGADRAMLGTRSNPVQSRGPFGEREYLSRLRCPDGAAPSFSRNGSVGAGEDGHILDLYSVICPSGFRASVYMDMYHGDVRERRAVPGFTALAELPARTATGCPPNVGPTPDSSARYVYNYLEVETPVRLLNPPAGPIDAGFRAYVSVSFVVDTTGQVEPATIRIPDHVEQAPRSAAVRLARDLRFTPAEHHPGCRVRQGTGVSLEFR